MLDALIEKEVSGGEIMEAFFLQALYWSLGGSLQEDSRIKFDQYVKYLSSMPTNDNDDALVGLGLCLHYFKCYCIFPCSPVFLYIRIYIFPHVSNNKHHSTLSTYWVLCIPNKYVILKYLLYISFYIP